MDGTLSEKEQLEAIREWWQENGRYILSGLVIGVALLVGWHYWTNNRGEDRLQASALYESLMSDAAAPDLDAAEAKASELYENYDATIYAAQARLVMAKLYMQEGHDQDAADALAPFVKEGDTSVMQMVARLRLARILLYQENPEEVVGLLKGYRETAFAARYDETLGDAYVLLGKFDQAEEAYTAALAETQEIPTVDQALIQMKIGDLPDRSARDASEAAGADAAGADSENSAADGTDTGEAGNAVDDTPESAEPDE